MVAAPVEVLRGIGEYAGRYGLRVTIDEEKGVVVIEHGEYPVRIVVEPGGPGYRVHLEVSGNLREVVGDLLEEEVDPRAELEDALETLIGVVDYAVRKLEEAGIRVSRETRAGILDVYDAIESYLEEEG